MSVNDKVLDEITGHSVDLQRLETTVKKRVLKQLKTLEANLVDEIKKSTVWGAKMPQTQKKRLKVLLDQTRETIKTSYVQIAKDSLDELSQVASLAEAQAVASLNTAISAELASTTMSRGMLKAIASDTIFEGAPSKEWWARRGEAFRLKFSDTIRTGMMKGETTDQVISNLIGKKVNRYKDGALYANYRSADALVRTSIQSIANEARLQTYAENDDIVKGVEWVATLDNRTSHTCQSLDGLTWDNNRKPIGHNILWPGVTAHWNCRSTQVPIIKSWEELGAKRKMKEIPESTRASMDGQVSKKKGYEDWLKGKPKAFQEDVLGKGKRKLWKDGKLGFSDLVDQSGNPLTLGQLQSKLGMVDDVVFDVPYVNLEKSYDTARKEIQKTNQGWDKDLKRVMGEEITPSKNNLVSMRITGETVDVLSEQATKALSKDSVKIHMAFNQKNLKQAIRQKEVMNSLQTGKGSYKTAGMERIGLEQDVFGIDDIDDVTNFPKYGFVASKDKFDFDRIDDFKYGENIIVFKDSVRKRTTVTFGDSYNGNATSVGQSSPPSPINKINEESFYRNFRHTTDTTYQASVNTFKEADDFMASAHYKDLLRVTKGEYVEAQIYGKLTLEEVEYILVKTPASKKAIEAELRKAGIDIEVRLR